MGYDLGKLFIADAAIMDQKTDERLLLGFRLSMYFFQLVSRDDASLYQLVFDDLLRFI